MTTNAEVEAELALKMPEFLQQMGIIPDGYKCKVNFHRGDRKKRRDAEFKGNWNPDADSIRIAFSKQIRRRTPVSAGGDLVAPIETETRTAAASLKSASLTPAEDRLSDLARALDRAEGRPGYEFVSLKWFRDTALTHDGLSWASDEFARHDVLREAIDRRWILTSKVANPRPPHFPVTAIRLNRQMPEVNAALGSRVGDPPAFRPVTIRGEALSDTVLRNRR